MKSELVQSFVPICLFHYEGANKHLHVHACEMTEV